ncbi:MAG: hypothetical protein ACERKD_05185 [Prolixibacteraceae bacterium]
MKILTSILFLFLLSSCLSESDVEHGREYEFIQCDSNCAEVKFSGRILNCGTGKGIPDIGMKMFWFPNDWGIDLRRRYYIDTLSSDEEGYFSFHNFIDTSLFSEVYDIEIALTNSDGDFIGEPLHQVYIIDDFSEPYNDSLNFNLYPRAVLTIEFIKTEMDTVNVLALNYHYGSDPKNIHPYRLAMQYPEKYPLKDGKLRVVTSAEIYTVLEWYNASGTNKVVTKDSIICERTTTNVYQLHY